jgi:hypothetical protein
MLGKQIKNTLVMVPMHIFVVACVKTENSVQNLEPKLEIIVNNTRGYFNTIVYPNSQILIRILVSKYLSVL